MTLWIRLNRSEITIHPVIEDPFQQLARQELDRFRESFAELADDRFRGESEATA